MTIRPVLPKSIQTLSGKLLDIDTHEMMPTEILIETFGEDARPWVNAILGKASIQQLGAPDYKGDVGSVDANTIWTTKGPTAPGAADPARRIEVMDAMAIDRQIMFPGFGLVANILYGAHEEHEVQDFLKQNTFPQARKMMHAYNEWVVQYANHSSRIRPVAPIYGETVEELEAMAEEVLKKGIRVIGLVPGRLPGGVSPAANALDRFYSMLEEARCPLVLHTGGHFYWFRTLKWGDAEAFKGYREVPEALLDPWRLQVDHLPTQNFVGTMVAGGVFDRHPNLYVGSMEYCGHWVGPLAQLLDLWYDNNQAIIPVTYADGSTGHKLPLRPSEYIARNVRVSPFDFEPVGKYIELHGLEDVYCFASDYPHVEGGKKPLEKFTASLEPLGSKVLEKFFVSNAGCLFRD
jgi:predicted TIM-barrel fold metal-dependent hydrolase